MQSEIAWHDDHTTGPTDAVRPLLDDGAELRAGPLTLSLRLFAARLDDRPLQLTRLEFDLLVYLLRQRGRVVSQLEILEHVVGTARAEVNSIVRVHISRLRAKLGHHAALIQTVRGRGFHFVAPDSDDPL